MEHKGDCNFRHFNVQEGVCDCGVKKEMEAVIKYFDGLMLKREFSLNLRDEILKVIFEHYGYDERNDMYYINKESEDKNG